MSARWFIGLTLKHRSSVDEWLEAWTINKYYIVLIEDPRDLPCKCLLRRFPLHGDGYNKPLAKSSATASRE